MRHPTAIIDDGAQIGSNTKIWHWTHICSGAVIGKNCSLGQNVFIGTKARIGSNVKIQNNVSIYDNVILEDDVFCGPSVVFTNVINPRSFVPRKHEYQNTLVMKGVSLGANSTIVCGCVLGEYSFVGAGAVVTKDVPANVVVAGNPAAVVKTLDESEPRYTRSDMFEDPSETQAYFEHLDRVLLADNRFWPWVLQAIYPRSRKQQ